MKKILYFTAMLVILGMAACGNRSDSDRGINRDTIPVYPDDKMIDTIGTERDSIDSIIPPTSGPTTPTQ